MSFLAQDKPLYGQFSAADCPSGDVLNNHDGVANSRPGLGLAMLTDESPESALACRDAASDNLAGTAVPGQTARLDTARADRLAAAIAYLTRTGGLSGGSCSAGC